MSSLTASRADFKVCDATRQGGDIDVTDATPIRRTRRALTALAAASFGLAGGVVAQPPPLPGHSGAGGQSLAPGVSPFQAQLPQRRQLTLAEAIVLAQSRYPGRVVRAQTIQ